MNLRAHIPNLFTIGNLVLGSIVVLHVSRNGIDSPVVFLLFIAGFLDVIDGAIARALKVSGELGKQLDSLADVISFGLAPTAIVYALLENNLPFQFQWLKYLAFLNVACAALRLARFNISSDQSNDFRGMPSPANGLFWGSIALFIWDMNSDASAGVPDSKMLLVFTLLMLITTSLLMISPVRMFSFKFRAGGFKTNRIPYTYIVLVILLGIFSAITGYGILTAIPLAIMLYMALSFVYHFQQK